MGDSLSAEVEVLKIVYEEIVGGVSISEDGGLFFRHFTELDNIRLSKRRQFFIRKYLSEGIPSEEERLKEIISNDEWSLQKEDDILSLRLTLSDNEKNLPSVIHQQQAAIKNIIEKVRKDLTLMLIERAMLLGLTAEKAAGEDIFHYNLLTGAYLDSTCQTPYFKSWEEIEILDEVELDLLHEKHDKALSKFTEKAIREMTVMPFFLNLFGYCKDDITRFFQKPIVSLTNLQTFMFSCGQRNLSVLSQADGNPPELIGDVRPADVLSWYDRSYSIILGKRNTQTV